MRAITGLLRLFSAVIVIAAIAVGLSLMLSTKGTGPEIDPRLGAVVEEWKRDMDTRGIMHSIPILTGSIRGVNIIFSIV